MKKFLLPIAFMASVVLLQAQAPAPPAPPAPPASGPGGPPGPGRRMMMPPVLVALDTNKDGELSAEEIAAATASLKTLDKDGDGKLSREEMFGSMGPRPDGKGGKGEGEGRPPREGGKRPGPQGPPPGGK